MTKAQIAALSPMLRLQRNAIIQLRGYRTVVEKVVWAYRGGFHVAHLLEHILRRAPKAIQDRERLMRPVPTFARTNGYVWLDKEALLSQAMLREEVVILEEIRTMAEDALSVQP